MRNLLKLDALAHQLYEKDADAGAFVDNFTLEELVTLWYLKCTYTQTNSGSAYDDEVYDALYRLGFWDYIKQEEKE